MQQLDRAVTLVEHVDVVVAYVLRHDHRGDRQPGRDQVREHGRLIGLERRDRPVAGDHRRRGAHGVGTAVEHVRHRHREIADQRGVRHVAEVDDAADRAAVVDEHVRSAHVVVDDLCAQPAEDRRDVRLEAVEHRGDHVPAALRDATDVGPLRRRTGNVPCDLVARRGMEEPSQPARDARDHTRPAVQAALVELIRPGMMAAQEREQPHEARPPRGVGDGMPERARPRRDDARDGQLGLAANQLGDRQRAHLDHVLPVGRVLDLEDVVVAHGVVEVALAGQPAKRTVDAVLDHAAARRRHPRQGAGPARRVARSRGQHAMARPVAGQPSWDAATIPADPLETQGSQNGRTHAAPGRRPFCAHIHTSNGTAVPERPAGERDRAIQRPASTGFMSGTSGSSR